MTKRKRRKKKGKHAARATLYFGYGSNMNSEQMSARCPQSTYAGTGALYGWEVVERLHADIERKPDGVAYGTLWYVPDVDLKRLDRYEGTPTYYERAYVTVISERGPETALVYVMTPKCKADRSPKPYSFGYALGCYTGAVEHGLPPHASFMRRIEKGETTYRPAIFTGPTHAAPWPEPEQRNDEEEFEQMVEDWDSFAEGFVNDYETDPDMLYDADADEFVPVDEWISRRKKGA